MRATRPVTVVGWFVLVALVVLPLAALAVQALSRTWFFPDLIPRRWTVEPFTDALASPGMRHAAWRGTWIALAVTAVAMAVGVPAGRALAFGAVRRPRMWLVAFLVPTLVPPLALAMGINVAALRLGIGNTAATVVGAHLVVAIPYAVLLTTAAMSRYDTGFERQAIVLGAGRTRTLVRVFLPIAAPGLAVAAVLVFVVSWGQYLLTLLPGGGRVVTPTLLALSASSGGNPTAAAAVAVITAVPPAVAVLAVVRHLDRLAVGSRGSE